MATDASDVLIGRATPWFHRRWLIFIVFLLGMSGWFAYDGAVGYPKQNRMVETFQKFKTEGRLAEWPTFARARGWPDAENMPELKTPSQIRTQFHFAIGGTVVGLVVLVLYLRRRGRELRVDADHLFTPEGVTVPLRSIRRVDPARWQDKGLATVYFEADGELQHVVIDGLSYGGFTGEKPYLADRILERVQAHLKPEPAPASPATPPAQP